MNFKLPSILLLLISVSFILSCNKTEASGNYSINTVDENHPVNWVSMQEAQTRAKQEGKWVLIDVYTEWCPYCRRMNSNTYTDEQVLKTIDDYYLPVRIDAESKAKIKFNNEEVSMQEFAMAFRVTSYPTTIIISSEGEPFAAQPGFLDAKTFDDVLTFVATEAYETMTFDAFQKQNQK